MGKPRTRKYYFTVEGETEQWYLEWLRDRINACTPASYLASFDIAVQKDPLKRAKSLSIIGKTEIWNLSDYESDELAHTKAFLKTMDSMKAAANLGKQITYQFGYSNLTFDLWIILHKADCNGVLADRRLYLAPLNRAYDTRFESMEEYKHEASFKRCLGQLSLEHVRAAIGRAERIMEQRKENGYQPLQYRGYSYYKENPSLSIHTIIKQILHDCKLL